MICEKCQSPHAGEYGSGRFCSPKCAHGFCRNKNKGAEARAIASLPEARAKADATRVKRMLEALMLADWSTIRGKKTRKKRILIEQDGKCLLCGIDQEWQGKPLNFQLDHINGQNDDNSRANLRMVCPNCHSQTETYCGRNKKLKRLCAEAGN